MIKKNVGGWDKEVMPRPAYMPRVKDRPIIYAWQARFKCRKCGKLYPENGIYHTKCMSCRVCGKKDVEMRSGYCQGCHPDPDDPWIRKVVPWPGDPTRNYPMWLDEEENDDVEEPDAMVARARIRAGVRVRIKSYKMYFFTRLSSEHTVESHREKIALRFPESESEYRLFLEDDDTYVLLRPTDILGDFPAWGEGTRLRFMKASWQGSERKRVVRQTGQGATLRRHH